MPGFREDKAYWEEYLHSYCKLRPTIDGAVVATADGEFIATVLPASVDQRLFAEKVADIASSTYSIASTFGLDNRKTTIYIERGLGPVTICCYPTWEMVLITLWGMAKWRESLEQCPDLTAPPTVAIGSKRIGPFPRFDEGEAEAKIEN